MFVRFNFIRSLTCLVFIAGLMAQTALFAVSDAERDYHFSVAQKLVDKDLYTIAGPAIEDFRAKSYDKGEDYADVLRLLYCRTFEVIDPGLSGELKNLEKKLASVSLPESLKNVVADPLVARRVLRYVNPLLRDLSPDVPPVTLSPDKVAVIQKRVALLSEKAQETMNALRIAIDENKADEEKNDAEELEPKEAERINRKAVGVRLAWANEFYLTFLAMREVIYHGKDYGLDATDAEAFLKVYLEDDKKVEELSTWDWTYGDYLLMLRHRLLIMQTEVVRMGHKFGDYGQTLAGLQDILDTDVSIFERKYQAGIVAMQLSTLSDMLLWHEGLQNNRPYLMEVDAAKARAKPKRRARKPRPNYAEVGLALWDEYRKQLKIDEMFKGRDQHQSNRAAQLYFVVARLHRMNGDIGSALGLVGKIIKVKAHPYRPNARRWKAWLVQAPSGPARDWYAAASPVDPTQALETAKELFSGAVRADDDQQRDKMYRSAAIVLRDAVLGLQDPRWRKQWISSTGPKVYQQYSYAMYKLGDTEMAAQVAIEGAISYAGYWVPSRGKKQYFKGKDGKPNKQGQELVKLIKNMAIYSSKLRRADPSIAGKLLYSRNMELQSKTYKDIEIGTGPKPAIIDDIANGLYASAIEKIIAFQATDKITAKDTVWCARLKAYCFYLLWDVAKKANSEGDLADIKPKLDAALGELDAVITKFGTETDAIEEAGKAINMKLAIVIGVAFRNKEYVKVLEALDEKFWENPPTESTVLQKLAGQMCGACYQYHKTLVKSKDPGVALVKNWSHFERAYKALEFAREKTGASLANSGKALAEALKNTGKIAAWCLENTQTLAPFDVAKMSQATRRAPELYGNLMMPLVNVEGAHLGVVLTVAQILDKSGDSKRSAILYEKYLNEVLVDAELQAFKENPKGVLNVTRNHVLKARRGFEKDWNIIYDLLFDKAGFNPDEDDSEEKRNFAKARRALQAFIKVVEAKRPGLGNNYQPAMDALVNLEDMAKKLSFFYVVQDYLVQAYIANGTMDRALPYIKALIAYDPLNPRYKALNVEVVLTQAKTVGNVSPAELKSARMIASELLRNYKNKPTKANEYWLAYCQAYELTAILGEPNQIIKSLKRHLIGVPPILLDLAIEDEGKRFTPRDSVAVQLIDRYDALYTAKGVTLSSPMIIKKNDGNVMITLAKGGE